MIPSLEGWPTKAKEAPSPHEVRMSPLDTNSVFQSLGGYGFDMALLYFYMLMLFDELRSYKLRPLKCRGK